MSHVPDPLTGAALPVEGPTPEQAAAEQAALDVPVAAAVCGAASLWRGVTCQREPGHPPDHGAEDSRSSYVWSTTAVVAAVLEEHPPRKRTKDGYAYWRRHCAGCQWAGSPWETAEQADAQHRQHVAERVVAALTGEVQ